MENIKIQDDKKLTEYILQQTFNSTKTFPQLAEIFEKIGLYVNAKWEKQGYSFILNIVVPETINTQGKNIKVVISYNIPSFATVPYTVTKSSIGIASRLIKLKTQQINSLPFARENTIRKNPSFFHTHKQPAVQAIL